MCLMSDLSSQKYPDCIIQEVTPSLRIIDKTVHSSLHKYFPQLSGSLHFHLTSYLEGILIDHVGKIHFYCGSFHNFLHISGTLLARKYFIGIFLFWIQVPQNNGKVFVKLS